MLSNRMPPSLGALPARLAAAAPTLATLLALTTLTWLLATWTWRLAAPGATGIGVRAPTAEPSAVVARRVAQHGVIAGDATPAHTDAPDQASFVAPPPDLNLRGVYAPRRGRGGFAILRAGDRDLVALIGQEFAPGQILEQVLDESVVIRHGAERFRLSLAAPAGGAAAVVAPPDAGLQVLRLGEQHFGLSRSAWAEATKSPEQLAAMGRFSLHPRGGALLESAAPEGLASRLGLNVGDIVTHINDRPIRGTEDASRILTEMTRGERVTLKVLRQGKVMGIVLDMYP